MLFFPVLEPTKGKWVKESIVRRQWWQKTLPPNVSRDRNSEPKRTEMKELEEKRRKRCEKMMPRKKEEEENDKRRNRNESNQRKSKLMFESWLFDSSFSPWSSRTVLPLSLLSRVPFQFPSLHSVIIPSPSFPFWTINRILSSCVCPWHGKHSGFDPEIFFFLSHDNNQCGSFVYRVKMMRN